MKILFKVKNNQISIEYSGLVSFKIDLDCPCYESIWEMFTRGERTVSVP